MRESPRQYVSLPAGEQAPEGNAIAFGSPVCKVNRQDEGSIDTGTYCCIAFFAVCVVFQGAQVFTKLLTFKHRFVLTEAVMFVVASLLYVPLMRQHRRAQKAGLFSFYIRSTHLLRSLVAAQAFFTILVLVLFSYWTKTFLGMSQTLILKVAVCHQTGVLLINLTRYTHLCMNATTVGGPKDSEDMSELPPSLLAHNTPSMGSEGELRVRMIQQLHDRVSLLNAELLREKQRNRMLVQARKDPKQVQYDVLEFPGPAL